MSLINIKTVKPYNNNMVIITIIITLTKSLIQYSWAIEIRALSRPPVRRFFASRSWRRGGASPTFFIIAWARPKPSAIPPVGRLTPPGHDVAWSYGIEKFDTNLDLGVCHKMWVEVYDLSSQIPVTIDTLQSSKNCFGIWPHNRHHRLNRLSKAQGVQPAEWTHQNLYG